MQTQDLADNSTNVGRQGWIVDVALPKTAGGSRWDVHIQGGRIVQVENHSPTRPSRRSTINGFGALLAPSLCHPHIHLDKAFLLGYPKYSHLQIEQGTFAEAMELTNRAKADFGEEDLEDRGQQVVDESVGFGVTHMRAFVEVDPIVDLRCLMAGRKIKLSNRGRNACNIQLCAFAQLPLFTGNDGGEGTRRLITEACRPDYMADAVGSTPYVEDERRKMEKNVEWMVDLALQHDKHLDFHLDYSLDPNTEPLVWHVVQTLKTKEWTKNTDKTVVLGHCTRLTLFKDTEWKRLGSEIGDLPISFVGLPTSDLYMMRTEHGARGTLPVPSLIKDYGFNAAIGLNNLGNAFTPQGTCDPLSVASLGVGVYQAGTKQDTEILYECVSTRARAAIGLGGAKDKESDRSGVQEVAVTSEILADQEANLLLFSSRSGQADWRVPQTLSDAVYHCDASRSVVSISGISTGQ